MTATTESPEARLYAAGFTRQLEFWLSPDGHRVLNLGDAIAALDSGAIKPAPRASSFPTRAFARCLMSWSTGSARRHSPPGSRRLGCWRRLEVIAAATVEKLKPLIRAECDRAVRAALRKGAKS